MTTLKKSQKKLTVLGKFLFNKQVELPVTIKECEDKLELYYRMYGYTYLDVVRFVTNKEVKITL